MTERLNGQILFMHGLDLQQFPLHGCPCPGPQGPPCSVRTGLLQPQADLTSRLMRNIMPTAPWPLFRHDGLCLLSSSNHTSRRYYQKVAQDRLTMRLGGSLLLFDASGGDGGGQATDWAERSSHVCLQLLQDANLPERACRSHAMSIHPSTKVISTLPWPAPGQPPGRFILQPAGLAQMQPLPEGVGESPRSRDAICIPATRAWPFQRCRKINPDGIFG